LGPTRKAVTRLWTKALLLIPELDHFLMQKPGEAAPLGETIEKLLALPG